MAAEITVRQPERDSPVESLTYFLQQLIYLYLQVLPPFRRAARFDILLAAGDGRRKACIRRELRIKQGLKCATLSVKRVVF